jgi:hypothetical protein
MAASAIGTDAQPATAAIDVGLSRPSFASTLIDDSELPSPDEIRTVRTQLMATRAGASCCFLS